MRKTFLCCFVTIILLSGCSIYHVRSQDTTADYYPSKENPNDVIYAETISQPHDIIGIITVNTERRWRISDVMEKMKKEAAVLGADAITDIQTDATGEWKALPAQEAIGNAYVRANFTAMAVAFK